MLIEATQKPIRYRLQTGEELYLKPGVPMEVPEVAARQLIQKAGDKVKVLASGRLVTWDSPMFGILSARVEEELSHGVRVRHPLTEVNCVIPREWICQSGSGDFCASSHNRVPQASC
jgi:hypothetical protein